MRDFARRAIAATVGAIALGCVGTGVATAADVPLAPQVRQPPPPQYYAEEEYYEPPPAYVVRPPAPVYGYPPVYPYYGPPGVAVVPRPYYRPYYYGGYGRGPYLARGYGYGGHYRYHGRYR